MLPGWLRLETDLKALSHFWPRLGKRDFDIFAQGADRPSGRISCKAAARLAKLLVSINPARTSGKSREPWLSSLPDGGLLLYDSNVNCLLLPVVGLLFAAFSLSAPTAAQADTFGTSGNEFTIDFVDIGNAGNAADTTTYGAVAYSYRLGAREISQDAIDKATASGMTDVTAGPWTGDQPAASLNWYEAAAFVNFLNTISGKTAAYDLSWSGTAWSMALWSSEQAWTAGGTNLYRNKDAYYFLPSENEWYKAAFYNPAGSAYFPYPTGSSTAPIAVASGTPTRLRGLLPDEPDFAGGGDRCRRVESLWHDGTGRQCVGVDGDRSKRRQQFCDQCAHHPRWRLDQPRGPVELLVPQ